MECTSTEHYELLICIIQFHIFNLYKKNQQQKIDNKIDVPSFVHIQ